MALFQRLALLLLLVAIPLSASAEGDDKVVNVARDDPDMTAAIKQARAGLDDFLKLAEAPAAGTDGYKLKVMVRDGDAVEHFWVIPFRRTEKGFEGTLANEPQAVSNVVAGQTIQFGREDISDWGYTRDGHQVGSFTVCAMFKQMPKEDVAFYRTNYGFDC